VENDVGYWKRDGEELVALQVLEEIGVERGLLLVKGVFK
jgi:hypothetical protein